MTDEPSAFISKLDISPMTSRSDVIIKAAESEDELGTVLRIHLVLEDALIFFLKKRITIPQSKYLTLPKDFWRKIGLSVAFGLPLEFADTFAHVGKMRNDLAHGKQAALQPEEVKKFRVLVTAAAKTTPRPPIEWDKIGIQGINIRGGEATKLGEGGPRLDFLIVFGAFWPTVLFWIIENLTRIEQMESLATSSARADQSNAPKRSD